jgi:CheY-like chemotaxis protein
MTAERGQVVVVDDDQDIREIVAMALGEIGYGVVGLCDGLIALEWLRSHPRPALILLDLMMPRLSGADFMRAHDSDERLAAVPVVIMSGDGGGCEAAAFPGARDCLRKPMDLDDLIAAVERFAAPPSLGA